MIPGLIFDLDGTTVVNEEGMLNAFKRTFSDLNITEPKNEDILNYMGTPLENVLENLNVDPTEYPTLKDLFWNYLSKDVNSHLVNGLEELLKELKSKGNRLVIVTSKTQKLVDLDRKNFELDKLFDYYVTSDMTEKHKPDPEPLIAAMNKYQNDTNFLTYVGDSIFDMKAATDAGLKPIGVTWGVHGSLFTTIKEHLLKGSDKLPHLPVSFSLEEFRNISIVSTIAELKMEINKLLS